MVRGLSARLPFHDVLEKDLATALVEGSPRFVPKNETRRSGLAGDPNSWNCPGIAMRCHWNGARWSWTCAAGVALLMGGCGRQRNEHAEALPTLPGSVPPAPADPQPKTRDAAPTANQAPSAGSEPLQSSSATSDGLEISFALTPEVRNARIPTRVLVLRFKNVSSHPLRIYMPASEPFRANISTIYLLAGNALLVFPEPHPHGYVVTEVDFPLLAPGEQKSYEQTFSVEKLVPGSSSVTQREKGFEPGALARVTWAYENEIERWQGGIKTLDGPTKNLFGGKDIPDLWRGKLEVKADWRVP